MHYPEEGGGDNFNLGDKIMELVSQGGLGCTSTHFRHLLRSYTWYEPENV